MAFLWYVRILSVAVPLQCNRKRKSNQEKYNRYGNKEIAF